MIAPHESAPRGAGAALAARIRAGIPVLETPGLILRAPEIGDFDAYADIVTGPRGAGIGGPLSREEAWDDFARATAIWLWRGHGAWTVTERRSGRRLGFVIIGFEPGDREPELGYLFTEAAEGRGLAFEAALAVRDHARDSLGLATLVSYVAADNTRSAALAARLGGRRDAEAEAALGKDGTGGTHVFRHDLSGGGA